jgi:hypothetical protein
MRILLITIAIFSLSFQVFAQVAAPSLDPSKENALPSVTSFRYFNTAALNYATGEMKSDDGKGDYTLAGGILALNLDGLGLELFAKSGKLEGEFDGGSGTTDFTRDIQISQVGISYIFWEFLSIGIGQFSDTKENEGSGAETFKEKSEDTATMISANIILSEVFFLGAGINSFTNKGTASGGGSAITHDKQEITWQENVYGAGLLLGDPGQFQLKAEISMKSSPEVGKVQSNDQEVQSNGKQKSDTTTGILELKSEEYFISYRSQTINEAEIDSEYLDHENGKKTTDVSTIGIGYINDEGLMLTVYSETQNEKLEDDKSGDEAKSKVTLMTFNIGYNF